ncbi:hypothetical protein CspeluHIS016_0407350 [Cutaneotrichosporon spelunceum]|uniref:Sin3 associated polypeptide p18-domain-containing protein n=1 Tax=Cutaneotrichosporon spelunceum TaxID=1672016 RepID=A0AAD3TWJ8_9TREE|nr:hypothetical protein CspeluHIS016_0407350 [Cutaneotrichosporon spelunceum]
MSRSPSRLRSRSRSLSASISSARSVTPEDAECPFLIRIFVTRKHTTLRDFDNNRLPTQDEFHVYGWKSSTPTSLVHQLYAVLPAPYRSPVARYSFKHVYVDASEVGLYKAREMVSFTGREFTTAVQGEGGRGVDDEETLDEYGFIKGDLISVAVSIPEASRRGEPAREQPRDRHPPPRGSWRDRRDGPSVNDRWSRRSRSRSPVRLGSGWGREQWN